MNPCPTEEQLANLLDELLGQDELAEVEAHLEICPGCQQALEELTYERFSAAEWNNSAGRNRPVPEQVVVAVGPAVDQPAPLIDSEILADQDSRRKRLILELFPRQPSSLHLSPSDQRDASDGRPESNGYPPQVDGYDIVGRLGRGGMGVVYRARQHGLDRLVALKMLRGGSHADPESLARFRIEVRAVARLRHPNVVQVFDVGESQGQPFVSLELLEGGSLEARNGGNPQPETDSATLVATLARAIASAHDLGIVHRDLKPANVLFSRDNVPKITDFGLAKRLDEDDGQTQSGQVMGSPSFMAPEQARGEAREIGPGADIYSLGAILYEMLTGRPPFKGETPIETLHQVIRIEPVAPSKLRPGLSRDLETICLKCLGKESSKRYPTADGLADDLDRFLQGLPIEARRVRAFERAWKWSKREPAAASLALVVGLAVIGSSFAVIRAVESSKNQTDRARVQGSRALVEAATATSDRRWRDGRDALKRFLQDAANEPSLDELRHQAEALLDQIQSGESAQKNLAEARANLAEFERLTRLAQLSDARWLQASSRVDGDPRPVRQATRSALALAGRWEREPNGHLELWQPADPSPWPTPSDRSRVDLASRELLLLLAEAIGNTAPGEDSRTQARQALAFLDRSFLDRHPSKAGWLLHARLSDALDDPSAAAAGDRRRAEALVAVDTLDRVAAGREHQLRGDWSRAIVEYEASLRLDPDHFRAQLALAVCELRAGRPEEARAVLSDCLKREPNSHELLLLRGVASGEAAGRRMDRARASRDADTQRDAARLFYAAEADFDAAEHLQPSDQDRLPLLMDRGIVRIRANRTADAESDFAEAVRLDPECLGARVNWGQALHRLGRIDEAVAQFGEAIKIDPKRSTLFRARALARLDRGDSVDPSSRDDAILDLSEAIRLGRSESSDIAGDLARRARLHHLARRFDDALADSEEALRTRPDQPDAALVRVQALLELKRYGEVVEACNSALVRRPTVADFWELRGMARSFRQQYLEAVGDFTQALTLDPGRLSARTQRGWAYLVSDASKLALADFEAAIRQAPEGAEAYAGRGFALAMAGQYRSATDDAEESLRKSHPGETRTVYNAARIYARCASGLSSASIGKRSPSANSLADQYGDRALSLIRTAIERLPNERRTTFYREVVQADPAFAGLRQRPQFARLAGQLGRPTQ